MTSVEVLLDRQFRRWAQLQAQWEEEPPSPEMPPPVITVSRQTGSRGSYFASRLAQRLDYQRIHREVVDAICSSSGYGRRIIENLDEHYRSQLEVLVDGILTGQAVDNSDYTRQLCRVVLSMSRLGGVVLVGRGGSFILGPDRGLHLRVVAPKDRRIHNLVTYKSMSEAEAGSEIERSDRLRREFIRKIFGADIDDPRNYDLVINLNLIDVEELVETVVVAYRGKMDKLAHLHNDQR
jgi:cytidylate kinase